MTTRGKRGHDGLRSMMKVVSGSSLFWAWGFLCFLSPVMFPSGLPAESSIGIEYGFFASQAGAVLFAAFVMVLSRRRRLDVGRIVFLVSALLMSVSALVLAWSLQNGNGWLTIICGIVDGICVPILGIAWGTRFSLRSKSILPLVVLSFLLAYLLYFLVSPLPYELAVGLVASMPLISWTLWNDDARQRHGLTAEVFSSEGTGQNPGTPGEFAAGTWEAKVMPWRALVIYLAASFIGNLVTSFILGQGYSGAEALYKGGVFVCACIATMSLSIIAAKKNSPSVSDFYRITLVFTAVGLVAILVFGAIGSGLGGAFIQGSALFLQVIIILAVTQSTQETGISPLLSFSVGQGVIAAVVLAANAFGKYLFQMFGTDLFVLELLCGGGLLVLFLMLVAKADAQSPRKGPGALGAEGGRSPLEPEAQDGRGAVHGQASLDAAWENRVASVAQGFKLTEREEEVLGYLAKGRTLPYIADALFVTTGTIKTHTLSIYRKLGVNSKQELLDLMEERSQ